MIKVLGQVLASALFVYFMVHLKRDTPKTAVYLSLEDACFMIDDKCAIFKRRVKERFIGGEFLEK